MHRVSFSWKKQQALRFSPERALMEERGRLVFCYLDQKVKVQGAFGFSAWCF